MAKFESKYDVGALVEFTSDTPSTDTKNSYGFVRAVKFANDAKAHYDIELANTNEMKNLVPEAQIVKQYRVL